MKKFLLSLCVFAVASACVFMTSCKDEDDNVQNYESILTAVSSMLDPTCTYTFTYGGKTYTTVEDLAEALANTAGNGSNVTIGVDATLPDGSKKTGGSVSGKVPGPGKAGNFNFHIPVPNGFKDGSKTVIWPSVSPVDPHNSSTAGN